MIYFLLICNCILIPILLGFSNNPYSKSRFIIKCLISLVAGFIGVLSYQIHPSNLALILLTALLFAFIGDVSLGLVQKNKKHPLFFVGMLAFACVHVIYIIFFFQQTTFHPIAILFPLLTIFIFIRYRKSTKFQFQQILPPLVLYAFLSSIMLGYTVSFIIQPIHATLSQFSYYLFCLGVLLFVISDIFLLFIYFAVNQKQWHRVLSTGLYMIGQTIIAFSIYFH